MRRLFSVTLLLAVATTPFVVSALRYPTPSDYAKFCVDQCAATANVCVARCEGARSCVTRCNVAYQACDHACGGDAPIIPDPANPDGGWHPLIPGLSAVVENAACQADCQQAWSFCLDSTDNPANCGRVRNLCLAGCRASPSAPSKSVGMDMKCLASCSEDRTKCTDTPDQCNSQYAVCETTCGLRVQMVKPTVKNYPGCESDCQQAWNFCLESTDNPANCGRIRNTCLAACDASPSSPVVKSSVAGRLERRLGDTSKECELQFSYCMNGCEMALQGCTGHTDPATCAVWYEDCTATQFKGDNSCTSKLQRCKERKSAAGRA